MKVLIVYGTIEGHTAKIAQFVEQKAQEMGHDVSLFDTTKRRAPVALEDVDRVVLAASVHERRHPQEFEVFVTAHRELLMERPTLMLSVSLSAAFEDGMAEAREYLIEMKMRTDFTPGEEVLVAGAVKTSSYDYFASQILRHVVLRDRDYDPGQGDHDFTDWDALETTLDRFLAAA